MKASVSTYSFDRLIRSGKMTHLDCIAKAKEMGFEGIELVELPAGCSGDEAVAYAEKFGEAARKNGLTVTSFTFSADFINGSGGDTQAEIKRVMGMIDLAKRMGASRVRHDVLYQLGAFRSFGQALPHLVQACRSVTEYAQTLGVRTMIENHGFICQESARVEALFNAVDHPNFGILADMGNFLCADEDPVSAYGRLAPYVFYAHVKDFIVKPGNGDDPGEGFFRSRGQNYLRGTIIGHGAVPVRQCIQILKSAGYDDFLTIEFEGIEEPIEAIRIGLQNLRSYISQD